MNSPCAHDFTIVKREVYGWRCNARFGTATHGYITTWNVAYGTDFRVIRGGVIEGNNTRSCVPYFIRRKDAAAWLAGLLGEALRVGADSEERSAHQDGASSRSEFAALLSGEPRT